MSRYGLRVRNKENYIQIDDDYHNLILTEVRRIDFPEIDIEDRPEATASETIDVNESAHVIAIQSITGDRTNFIIQPSTRPYNATHYRYFVRPGENKQCSCRVFVFTSFNGTAKERYGLRINASNGPAFISSLPYMRVVGLFHIDRNSRTGSFDLPDPNREYAAAIMSFSCRTLQRRFTDSGNEQELLVSGSLCRGVYRENDRMVVGADFVSLVGNGTDVDTDYLEPTSVLVLDVTGLY